jgi:NADH:ubiquinone oxidoreductase subunit 4 (subunit M)
MPSHLLTVIALLPLLGVPALLLLRGDDHTWIRRIALVVSLAEFAISVFIITWAWMASACFWFCSPHF